MDVNVFLATNFKGTAQIPLGSQPVILPTSLKQHFQSLKNSVKPLLLRAGMSIDQLNDPQGLALPAWGSDNKIPINADAVQSFSGKVCGIRFGSTNYRAVTVLI